MKKRLIISSVISIFLVSVLLLGSTYSIFTSQEIDETANVYKTGNLNVTYSIKNVDNKNSVQITDPTPMTTEEADAVMPYRITVTNKGNVPYEFDVILLDTTSSEENTIDYQYIMTKVGYLEPVALSNCTNNIIKENVIVPAGKSVDIDVRIWLDSTLPNTEMGKSFYAKLKIDGLAVYNDDEDIDNSKLSLRYMKTSSTNDFRNDAYRTYITTASFVDYIDTSNASINTDTSEKIMWDMSSAQDESVIAWLEDNGEVDESGNKLYDLYIGSIEKIYVKNFASFFSDLSSLLSISFKNLDTSLTTDMRGLFKNLKNITDLDLSSFDTSNVEYMASTNYWYSAGMFEGMTSLTDLDLSNFDTSKVVYMSALFYNCRSLENINLVNFDTSNVVDMMGMFYGCESLTILDLNNFNVSNVKSMYDLFYGCINLESIKLDLWDTSNVTNMGNMFSNCSSLTTLDVSGFNTNNATSMLGMFQGCSSLTQLDVSNWDISNVKSLSYMFKGCSNLIEIDFSNWDTANVNDMSYMFQGCSNLIELDLSSLDTSNVTNMRNLFDGCFNLVNLLLDGCNFSNVREFYTVFYKCYKVVTTITISNPSLLYNGHEFGEAAINDGAQIVVNYVGDNPETIDVDESTENIVDEMIASVWNLASNIVKGECIGNYCSV